MKKVLGFALIIFGAFGLIVLFVDFNILTIITSGILILIGRELVKAKKVKSKSFTDHSASSSSSKKHLRFNVVGISKKNDQGEDIQNLIKQYIADEIDSGNVDPYDGLSNNEILESGDDVYEVELSGDYEIKFEFEPNNPYDPNAIKVMHEEIGHIGYVPRESTQLVKEALENNADVEWKLLGGKLKYIDEDSDRVKTKNLTYGVAVDLYY